MSFHWHRWSMNGDSHHSTWRVICDICGTPEKRSRLAQRLPSFSSRRKA